MRQIVLDTETTGLDAAHGDRIIEVGAVELKDRKLTGQTFHVYLNPERTIEDGAFDVHGISNEFLADKPRFGEIAAELIQFVRGGELIIHNAPFDTGFLNAEFAILGKRWGRIEDYCNIVDSLRIARDKHPGQKNSLDALCSRYLVDNSGREYHGALLDARILAEVYLAMTGGQTSLLLLDEPLRGAAGGAEKTTWSRNERMALRIIQPNAAELELHNRSLSVIDKASGGKCIWRSALPDAPS
jgi:DNA polymerase-3 subunit epsilon